MKIGKGLEQRNVSFATNFKGGNFMEKRFKGQKVYGQYKHGLGEEEKQDAEEWADLAIILQFLDYKPNNVLEALILLQDVVVEMNNREDFQTLDDFLNLAFKTFGRERWGGAS